MFRRFQVAAVLLAWLLATGSQWDLVQVAGWARMIVSYSRTRPLAEAVRLTFTPGNECEVCDAVSAAKQQPDNPATPAANFPGKVLLIFQPAPIFVLNMPEFLPQPPGGRIMLGASRASPPVPPPRAV